ncbi:hypothetical protein M3J57_29830, partial [Klebsiella pneumoniae]|nr:hypothetical protein [Klebsiella pneumoniae]
MWWIKGEESEEGVGEKEAKAPEVVTIKKESQDVQVPTGDAVGTIQAKEIEADTVIVKNGGLTEVSSQSDRQPVA